MKLYFLEKNQYLNRFINVIQTIFFIVTIVQITFQKIQVFMDMQIMVRFVPDERLSVSLDNLIQRDKIKYYEKSLESLPVGKYLNLSCTGVRL